MTTSSYGAKTRRPVHSGTRRIPGLYERTLADGSTVYDAALRLGGKVQRHRLEAATKTDAIAELRALQVDYARGEQGRSPSATVTVAELAGDWLAHLDGRIGHSDPRRRYSARTVDKYRQRLSQHIVPAFGHRDVTAVTLPDLRRLIDKLGKAGLAPATVTSVINIISGMFRFGVKSGALERNIVRDLDRDDRPGVARQSEPRYLAVDELELLLGRMGDTFRPVAAVCAFAGLRLSETLGLEWRNVDLKAGTITVTAQLGTNGERVPVKTAASMATVPMLPALNDEIHAHRSRVAGQALARVRPEALVFTTSRGKPHGRRNVLRAVHAAGDAAGLNGEGRERVGVHDLRHSFVGVALAAGMTIPETAALARHSNPRVTATMYAGLSEQSREGLAGKLAEAFSR